MTDKPGVTNCFTCQTRSESEWCNLNNDELALLEHAKKGSDFGAAELIYTQGEECAGVYCIESGLVGLRKFSADGKSTLVRLHGPGQTIGYRAFLTRSDHQFAAEVLEPARVCFIPSKIVQELLEKNPALGLHLLRQRTRDLSESDERFAHAVTHSARSRLLHILLVLSERFGHRDHANEYVIDLPISRQDLAALVGVAPESLSRIINQLQTAGIADFDHRRVHIHDVAAAFKELELVA